MPLYLHVFEQGSGAEHSKWMAMGEGGSAGTIVVCFSRLTCNEVSSGTPPPPIAPDVLIGV